MARHVEMQAPTPIVGKDDKHEQDAAGERGHRKEIDRDGRFLRKVRQLCECGFRRRRISREIGRRRHKA